MSSIPETPSPAPAGLAHPPGRLWRRQAATVALLFTGYAAYYFCRADFAVATPLLADELTAGGMATKDALIRLGDVSSLGVAAYALGKMFLGGLGDFWGGRRSFLIGLGGATAFTLIFASGGMLPLFTIAWIGNRLTQSIGWAGLLKVCSRWFDFSSYAKIVGFLSLSYLIGDVVARHSMGVLIEHGYGWRALFCFAAAVAGLLLVLNLLFLRESRVEAGYSEAKVNPANLFADSEGRPRSVRALLMPLLRSKAFVLVCLLSFGCTVVRETFNAWTPLYLHSFVGYSQGRAASLSAVFPLLGAASVLATGWLADRIGANRRALPLLVGLIATAVSLAMLTTVRSGIDNASAALTLIGVVAFCLLGPYSYLGGAFALDFGGKQAGAMSSGIIDGVGYLGGILAGDTVARIAGAFGWRGVFIALAIVSMVSAMAAASLFIVQRRQVV